MDITATLEKMQAGKHNLAIASPTKAIRALTQEPEGRTGKVLQCFVNSDLRCGHDGLAEVARKAGIDVTQLSPGQYVVFLNSAKTMLKLYAANHILVTLRSPSGKLEMRAIAHIPQAFNGGRIDYDQAVKEVLTEALKKRSRTVAAEK